jgi:AbrB family looped-hinge helix DNA binding protein
MTTILTQKGQIVLPSAVREQMNLKPGHDFEVFNDDKNTILLRRINRPPNYGLIELLQSSPYPFELPPRANDQPRSIDL